MQHFKTILNLLNWLKGMPGGLKLNAPLGHFLGNVFANYMNVWKYVIIYLFSILPFLLKLSFVFGCFYGVILLFSIAVDFFRIFTLHLVICFVVSRKLYEIFVHNLLSMYRHFMGIKWNVLRRRIDSCELRNDQLFVNTLFLMNLLFLFPTVAVYYYAFTAFVIG
ncbi:phosphatidylinositol N-acetylglucosaminyltransferase subunit Q-like [Zophobas morio]|uniref:phosphatidylinositol N-acetylglucosaminyltransferase subunit Q-like n=1 Tax=Zophobas morio TaxID=2755281 RepID=UPI003083442E